AGSVADQDLTRADDLDLRGDVRAAEELGALVPGDHGAGREAAAGRDRIEEHATAGGGTGWIEIHPIRRRARPLGEERERITLAAAGVIVRIGAEPDEAVRRDVDRGHRTARPREGEAERVVV